MRSEIKMAFEAHLWPKGRQAGLDASDEEETKQVTETKSPATMAHESQKKKRASSKAGKKPHAKVMAILDKAFRKVHGAISDMDKIHELLAKEPASNLAELVELIAGSRQMMKRTEVLLGDTYNVVELDSFHN